jgi:RHS repeat-associated protein
MRRFARWAVFVVVALVAGMLPAMASAAPPPGPPVPAAVSHRAPDPVSTGQRPDTKFGPPEDASAAAEPRMVSNAASAPRGGTVDDVMVAPPDGGSVRQSGRLSAATVGNVGAGQFAGPDFTNLSQGTAPLGRSGMVFVYDAFRNVDWIFGGKVSNGTTGSATWKWDGQKLTDVTPGTVPAGRKNAMAAYNPNTHDVIVAGGNDSSGNSLSDTWKWNGTSWTQLSPTTPLPALEWAGMTWSDELGKIVLFGGVTRASGTITGYSNDTWTFDGTTWTKLTLATKPSARGGVQLAHDDRNGNVVLFGGLLSGGTNSGETWTFNGTAWTQVSTTYAPSALHDYGLAYNSTLRGVELVGGYSVSGSATHSEQWVFDGSNWYKGVSNIDVGARQGIGLAEAPTLGGEPSGQLTLYGGFNGASIYSGIYSLSYDGLGRRGYYTFDQHKLTDRTSLDTNVANLNAVYTATDLHVSGVGLDLSVNRTYQIRMMNSVTLSWGWTFDTGADVYLSPTPNGAYVLFSAGGGDRAFFAPPAGTNLCGGVSGTTLYTAPAQWNADLCKLASGALTLTYHQSQTVMNFNSSAQLTSMVDRNGNTISYAYNGDGSTQSITDTEGRALSFTYSPAWRLTQISDSASRTYQYGYDGNGRLSSFTDPAGKVTSYTYDVWGHLEHITDPLGNVTVLGTNTNVESQTLTSPATPPSYNSGPSDLYDPTQTIAASGDPGSAFRKVKHTDPGNHDTNLWVDPKFGIVKSLDPLSHTKQNSYSGPNEEAATITDGLSQITTLAHDNNSNLTSMTGAATSNPTVTNFVYGTTGVTGGTYLPSSSTDPQGNCRAFTYDAAGNQTVTSEGLSGTGSPRNCSAGGSQQTTRKLQGSSVGGTAIPSCTSDGLTTTFKGLLCATVDARGNTTSYSYTVASGRLTQAQVTKPGGTCSTPRNLCSTTTFDTLTRVSTVTDSGPANSGAGTKTTYCYDNLDRITKLFYTAPATTPSCSSAADLTYVYDDNGNLLTRVDGTGPTSYTYDTSNRATHVVNYRRAVVGDSPVSYWRLGEATGTTAADLMGANAGTYNNTPALDQDPLQDYDNYDAAVNFNGTNEDVSIPSASSLNFGTTFSLEAWISVDSYPSAGSFASIISKKDSYSLKFNGNLLEFTIVQGATSQVLQYGTGLAAGTAFHLVATYDGVTQRLYVDGTQVASRAQTGAPTSTANSLRIGSLDGTSRFFDGTIDEVAVYNTALSANQVWNHDEEGLDGIAYTYDAQSTIATSTDANGTTTYTHDAANNLTRMVEDGGTGGCTTGSGTTLIAGCTSFAYDNNDRRTVTRYPGGATMNATYDADGNQLTAIGKDKNGAVLTSFTYCYQDLVSGSCPTSAGTSRSKITQQIQNDTVTGNVAVATNYLYDGNGRLCASSTATGGSCASPPGGANKYSYDLNGNRTQSTIGGVTNFYAYNSADQLCYSGTTSLTCSSANYTYDGNGNTLTTPGSGSFTYNDRDQTTAVTLNGVSLTGMTYSDVGQTDRAAVTQGGTTTEFLTSPLGVTRNNVGSTSSFTMRDTHGNVVGWVDSTGGHWYYLLDGRGSVVAVVSSDGLTRGNRYAYDDWGNQTFTCSACNGGTPLVQPWGYASGYTDTTKLTKFGTRYYNPNTATWTQQDSVASQPRYQYVGGDPINGIDRSGYSSCGQLSLGGFVDCASKADDVVIEAAKTTALILDAAASAAFLYVVEHIFSVADSCYEWGEQGFYAAQAWGPAAAYAGAVAGCVFGVVADAVTG